MMFSFTNKTNCSRGSALSQVCGPNRPETITYSANLEHLFFDVKIIRILLKHGPLLRVFLKASFGLFLMEFSCEGKWLSSCLKFTNSIGFVLFTSAFMLSSVFKARKLTFA
jgi:hypothetical protein